MIVYGLEVRHSHTHHIHLDDLESGLVYSHPWLYGPPPAYDDEAWGDLTLPVYVGVEAGPPGYDVVDLNEVSQAQETDALLG